MELSLGQDLAAAIGLKSEGRGGWSWRNGKLEGDEVNGVGLKVLRGDPEQNTNGRKIGM